ncbi:P-loop NTPase fold protein [Kitasatospora sp. NPDC002040]|uniref:P-loop NTPase fold protein n=1 Tax=Kitasatospora sp. NPDC002040 TaxID=3154661 RepID=UPI0033287F80
MDFLLLNDEPVRGDSTGEDVLGTARAARDLAALIQASRAATPFTVAIDADWGMGKSSLMHRIEAVLQEDRTVECVWFNAWTANGTDALEGVIKSVLQRFDRNLLRRIWHRTNRSGLLVSALRTVATLLAGVFRVDRIVDELWERMAADAAARNAIRKLIADAATEWAAAPGAPDRRRLLVVFVDDLDRCSDETILAVCEAIKIYLDVPGLAFVLGCDQRRIADVAEASGRALSADYLQKIVQVNYRMPPIDPVQAARLVERYAEQSGTSALLTPPLAALVAERMGRNPRRIKRLINGFVMEYHLDAGWQQLGAEGLLRAMLLQQLYPDFHRALVQPGAPDLVAEFVTYYEVRGVARRRGAELDPARAARLTELAERLELDLPGALPSLLEQLEQALPPEYPLLAADRGFVRLLLELDQLPESAALLGRLRRTAPLEPTRPPVVLGTPPPLLNLQGARVLWVDDIPVNNARLVRQLRSSGAEVLQVEGTTEALARLDWRPHVLITDLKRGNDPRAGIQGIRAVRAAGFGGPVIVYSVSRNVTLLAEAELAGAQLAVRSPTALVDLIEEAVAAAR